MLTDTHVTPMTPVKTRPDSTSSPKDSPRTPNRPILQETRMLCMSSPLRFVGCTSPCSTKLQVGFVSHIEHGIVTDHRPNRPGDYGLVPHSSPVSNVTSPVHSPTRGLFHELSFANLLDSADEHAMNNNGGMNGMSGMSGMGGMGGADVAASPRKRPRKHAPTRCGE